MLLIKSDGQKEQLEVRKYDNDEFWSLLDCDYYELINLYYTSNTDSLFVVLTDAERFFEGRKPNFFFFCYLIQRIELATKDRNISLLSMEKLLQHYYFAGNVIILELDEVEQVMD